MALIINNKGYLYVSVLVFDEKQQKKIRKRISAGYKDTPANKNLIEKNINASAFTKTAE